MSVVLRAAVLLATPTTPIWTRVNQICRDQLRPLHTGRVLSRDHQFYFRVETNAGYHFDVVPLDALLQGLEKQLITNQVVTNSNVNRNKKRKGK